MAGTPTAMLVACGLYVASMIRLVTLGGSLHKRDCKIFELLFPSTEYMIYAVPYYPHS